MAWNNTKTHQFRGYKTRTEGLVVQMSKEADNACEVMPKGSSEVCIGVVKEPNIEDGKVCGIVREGMCMFVADGPIKKGEPLTISTTTDGYVTKGTTTNIIGYAGQDVSSKDELFEGYLI